ncbi:MAG: anthrone oxygenase family protein [Ktedonobacteraceae bacterium]
MYSTLILLNFITLGLLVGGLFFVNIAVAPTFTALSTGRYAEFHHVLDRYSDPYMPILTFSTALLAIGELWFTPSPWQFVSRLIGVVCIVSVALISILVHGPLNRRIRTWQPDRQIEHLSEIRARWVAAHRVRTIIAFVGLIALLLPVVFSSWH